MHKVECKVKTFCVLCIMKTTCLFFLFLLFAVRLPAQDAVIIREGNFVRGLIKGTDYTVVVLQKDDQTIAQYDARAIHSFIWNGETYISKPVVEKKKAVYRFFKLLESGVVNLYSLGDKNVTPQPQPARVKMKPSFGVSMGTGGFGGMGGGISIGTGGNRAQTPEAGTFAPIGKVFYFIEKPGSGPMVEIVPENTAAMKTILLQKLSGDDDLTERIKASDSFTDLNLLAYIKAYNAGQK